MAQLMHVLFEHATGYALFKVREFEEMLLPQLEAGVVDFAKFSSIVQLQAFAPFRSGSNALDNINSISEGILHEDLRLFIDVNCPEPRQKVTLGVGDAKIGTAISEDLRIKCQHFGAVPEIIRGIRLHFHRLVKGLAAETASKAQLGLGHSYSRAKVKFNVHRSDNMIIQAISLLDQLDKDINTFSMRIREWYSYHFPELMKIVTDNHKYAIVTKMIGDRKLLDDEKIEQLGEITGDDDIAHAIVAASKSSMGMDISPIDLINIELFATRVIALGNYRKSLQVYLRNKMDQVAPSLAVLIGDMIGARLISHAGSLTNLAKYPASTVQILGAEKALFRALKNKGNTPKYGLIFHSGFIGRAALKNKGRISRYLANKCSIASRIDCFSDVPTTVFGDHLKQQVEDRLKFYTSGDIPDKNLDVMQKASDEAEVVKKKIVKKQLKRQRKADQAATEAAAEVEEDAEEVEEGRTKKKKKRKSEIEVDDEDVEFNQSEIVEETHSAKKKKKNKNKSEKIDADEVKQDTPKQKKKKKESLSNVDADESMEVEDDDEIMDKTPKKKNKKKSLSGVNANETFSTEKKSKKGKKGRGDESMIGEDNDDDDEEDETPKKNKKKKKKSLS